MFDKETVLLEAEFTSEVLELIDGQNDGNVNALMQSDLQGRLGAIFFKYFTKK